MELIFAIADVLNRPNEFVFIDKVCGNLIWFHTAPGAQYTCKTARGKFLKKNSVRVDC